MSPDPWSFMLLNNHSGMAPNLPRLIQPLYDLFQASDEVKNHQEPLEGEPTNQSLESAAEGFKAVLNEYIQDLAPRLPDEMSDVLSEQRIRVSAFTRRLQRRWGPGLKLLAVIGQLAVETGAELNAVAQIAGKAGPMLTALTSIHARGCQVFQEILVLLRHGFAEGADARWRTLHELSVTALFIAQKGETVAQRYLDYDAIEVAEGSAEYEEWHKRLGFESLGEEVVIKTQERVEQFKKKYGTSFASPYGWARSALGPDDGKGFKALERAVKLEHWRPMYRGACHSIHAAPRRVFFSVSQPGDELPILAVGPSNYGLADPGQNAALSLVQLTTAFQFFTIKDLPIDLYVLLGVMDQLSQVAADTLVDIHFKLEQELKEEELKDE